MRGQPTARQLLILADRADRGLTPAEQDRLRAGIRALDAARRSAARHLANQTAAGEQHARQLTAVADLVHRARYRGARAVTVWALDQVLGPAQRPSAATGSGAAVADSSTAAGP